MVITLIRDDEHRQHGVVAIQYPALLGDLNLPIVRIVRSLRLVIRYRRFIRRDHGNEARCRIVNA